MRKARIDIRSSLHTILAESCFINQALITKGIKTTDLEVRGWQSFEACGPDNRVEVLRLRIWLVPLCKRSVLELNGV